MGFLMENYAVIVVILCVGGAAAVALWRFAEQPTQTQINMVQQWLLWAVTQAESELGSGTGALKLRYVYDLFVGAFPWMVPYVSFETFSELVDKALDELQALLSENSQVSLLVKGEDA